MEKISRAGINVPEKAIPPDITAGPWLPTKDKTTGRENGGQSHSVSGVVLPLPRSLSSEAVEEEAAATKRAEKKKAKKIKRQTAAEEIVVLV